MRAALTVLALLIALPARADVLDEPLGKVRHMMTEGQVAKAAGAPKTKTAPESAGEATGDFQKTWDYGAETVTFAADKPTSRVWKVRAIDVRAGSTWKTKRGIGIGASRAAVEKAYKKVRDPDGTDDEHFTAGSIYGGIVFEFADGKVKSIFVGAAAF